MNLTEQHLVDLEAKIGPVDLEDAEQLATRLIQSAVRALPLMPDSLICECGVDDGWTISEPGYFRYTDDVEVGDGVLIASTDGWDDMSEGGVAEYVTCEACGKNYQPGNIDWN